MRRKDNVAYTKERWLKGQWEGRHRKSTSHRKGREERLKYRKCLCGWPLKQGVREREGFILFKSIK